MPDPEPTPAPAAESQPTPAVPEGYVLRADLEAAEARRHSLQSENGRLKAEVEKLKAVTLEQAPAPTPAPAQLATPESVAEVVMSRLAQREAIKDARRELAEKFPLAPASVLNGAFDSPEELSVAVEQAHAAAQAYRDSVRTDLRSELISEFKDKYGVSIPDPAPQAAPSDGEHGTRPPSARDLASMPFSEFVELDPAVTEAAARA